MIQHKQLPFPIKKYTTGSIRDNFVQIPGITRGFPRNCLIGLPLPHLYGCLMGQLLNVYRAVRLSCQHGEQGMQLLGLTEQISVQDELQVFLRIRVIDRIYECERQYAELCHQSSVKVH